MKNNDRSHSIFSSLAVFAFVVIAMDSGTAQTDNSWYNIPDSDEYIANMTLDDLMNTYDAAKLFHQLDAAQQTFDETQYCGKHLDEADETTQELEQLNQIRNKTTSNYSIRAAEVKEANNKAQKDYERCYDKMLPGFDLIRKEQIFTFTAFASRYDAMVGGYESIANLDTYLLKLKEEIDRRTEGQGSTSIVATIHSVTGSVTVSPGGVGQERHVQAGYKLREADILSTGRENFGFQYRYGFSRHVSDAGSQAVIVFDYENGEKVRLTIGARARVRIGDLNPREINAKKAKQEAWRNTSAAVKVMYGLVHIAKETAVAIKDTVTGTRRKRTFKDNVTGTRRKQTFHVRTSTSLCGIRGTELVIGHNSSTGKSEYHLDHGEAFVAVGGQLVDLQPLTSVTVQNSNISAPSPLPASEFEQIRSLLPPTRPVVAAQRSVAIATGADQSDRAAQSIASNASQLTSELLTGLRDADVSRIYKNTGGAYHTIFNERRAQSGDLVGYLQKSEQRPNSFKVGCTVCEGDSKKCWTYADITSAANAGKQQRVIFESQSMGSRAVIFTSRDWSAENERSFHQKGRAYCE